MNNTTILEETIGGPGDQLTYLKYSGTVLNSLCNAIGQCHQYHEREGCVASISTNSFGDRPIVRK